MGWSCVCARAVERSARGYGSVPAAYSSSLADTLVDRALHLDPDLPEALVVKGLLHHYRGEFEASLAVTQRALQIRPSYPDGLKRLTFPLIALGRQPEALAALEEAHRLDPLSESVVRNLSDQYAQAGNSRRLAYLADHTARALPHRPEITATIRFHLAMAERRYADALRDVQFAWQRLPQNIVGYWLGTICLRLNSTPECMSHGEPTMRFFLAMLQSRDDDARALRRTFPALPESPLPGAYLSLILHELRYGEPQQADQLFAEVNPEETLSLAGPLFNSFLYSQPLIYTWIQVQQQNGDKVRADAAIAALVSFADHLEREGNLAASHYPRAVAHAWRGEREASITALRAAWDAGHLFWYRRAEAAFASLASDAEFVALFDEIDRHIDGEHAKLNWPPVPD